MTAGTLPRVALWLACLAPIAFLPGALDRWFLPKAVVLAAACAVARFARTGDGRLPRWFAPLMAAAAVVLVTAAALSPAPWAEIWGRWPRYEGAVMLPVYVAAVWLGARILGPTAPSSRSATLVSAVATASLLLGFVSLLETIGLRPLGSSADRPGALLGNASDQGLVGVVFAAVLLLPTLRAWAPLARPGRAVAKRGKVSPPRAVLPAPTSSSRRVVLVAALFAAVFTIVASASRGAAAAAAVTVVVHLVIELRRAGSPRQRRTIIVVSGAVLVVVVATTLALPATRARFVSTDGLAFESAADRLLIWREALAVIAQRPVLGWGPSGFLDAVGRVHGAQWQRDVGSATTLDSPHNWILQLLSAGGILLLCAGLAAIVLGLVSARTNWTAATRPLADGLPVPSDPDRADVLAAAVAALSGLAVGWSVTFTAPGTVILPALLFGALVARAPAPKRAPRRPLGALRSVGVVAWCAFLGVAAVADIPLGNGVTAAAAGDIGEADSAFETTARLRPWDADVASIAAQSMAASADAGNASAAPLATTWARRALRSTPGDLLASKALAVGEQYTGDLDGAVSTLRGLADDHPYDSEVAQRLGGVLLLQGKLDDATTELVRASELAPDDVDIWKTLAFAYQQSGDEAGQTRAEARIADLSGGGR